MINMKIQKQILGNQFQQCNTRTCIMIKLDLCHCSKFHVKGSYQAAGETINYHMNP